MDMMQGSDDASLDGSAILPMTVNPSNRSTHTTGSRKSNEGFDSASRSSISNRAAVIRSNNEETAMSQKERTKVKFRNFINQFSSKKATGDEMNISHPMFIPPPRAPPSPPAKKDNSNDAKPQYRLEATNKLQWNQCLPCMNSCTRTKASSDNFGGINPNQHVAQTLHWMFRSSFFVLFAVMCTLFFGQIIVFAGFIVAVGRYENDCVRVGGEPIPRGDGEFADAFTLSWTTFSTVGYGNTYPALSHENTDPANCVLITFICSLEAFLGVLYSGFCGAILFGKVLRIQSHAQVIFSDPIIVKYGSGMEEHSDESGFLGNDDEDRKDKIPCPVLEFGIVNRLFGETGGEIIDASLNVVANVNARDADPVLKDALDAKQRSKHLRKFNFQGGQHDSFIMSDTMSDDDTTSGRMSLDSKQSRRHKRSTTSTILDSIIKRQHLTVDEDPSSSLINKRLFSKMEIEAPEHPYFKRRWVGRHVLNEDSPLVKPKVKRMIRKNKGFWPESLNNYTAVRESIMFNQILVSLNGVSNLSASEVYAQKIYDFVDMNVGYQFVNTLYKDADGTLKIDTDLINDVREQHGGGGEPLIFGD